MKDLDTNTDLVYLDTTNLHGLAIRPKLLGYSFRCKSKFCHICKKKFYYVDKSDNDSDCDNVLGCQQLRWTCDSTKVAWI